MVSIIRMRPFMQVQSAHSHNLLEANIFRVHSHTTTLHLQLALGRSAAAVPGQVLHSPGRVQRRPLVQHRLIKQELGVVQVVHGAERLVADAQERHGAGRSAAVERKVLPCHQRLHRHGRVSAQQLGDHLVGEGHRGRIVDGGWVVRLLLQPPVHRHVAAVAGGHRGGQALHAALQALQQRVVQAADGASKVSLVGDDVVRVSRAQQRHAQHRGPHRAGLAADQRLQRGDDARGGHDGVDVEVRDGGVPAAALDNDVEGQRARHDGARARAHLARGDVRHDVHTKHRLHSLQRAFLNHVLPARPKLLIRLEHQPHGALQLRLHTLEQLGRTQQHGGVAIVTASMHPSLVLATEGHEAFRLLDGQGVNVRTQSHYGLLACPYRCHDASLEHLGEGHAQLPKNALDGFRRLKLAATTLWDLMQLSTSADYKFLNCFGF
mmetsp:Transcript_16170/g.40266  ORF Transcript_16170/g.40266 Transcript_16170/m.40266 type:complete len:436 (-) Transcript_16170:89-1396(-)